MTGKNMMIGNWPATVQCALWVVLSGTLMTLQFAIVREISPAINVFEIIFFRSLFGIVAVAPVLIRGRHIHFRPNRPWLLLLCGTLAFIASVFFYLAVQHLPLADIIAIHFTRPVFAALAAAVILREAIRGSRATGIVVGLIGAAIIIRPGLVDLNIGVLYVLAVVAVQSWNPINRKLLSKSEHPDTVAIWIPLVILPLSAVASVFVWTTPTLEQLAWMALIGILEILNQRILARAYVLADAVVVVTLHYTRLPIAALIGFVIFGDVPEIWIWIGGAIIAAGSIQIAWRESIRERERKAGG